MRFLSYICTSCLGGLFHKESLSLQKEDVEVYQIHVFLEYSTQGYNSKDAFHCISELRVVSDANQLSILVEYIFIENVCVFMENR